MFSSVDVAQVTVVSGQTDSPAMITEETISDAEQIVVQSPAGLVATATIQISLDFDVNYKKNGVGALAAATAAATWVTAPGGGALGAAGAVVNLDAKNLLSHAWRIHLSASDAADRTFNVQKRAELT